MPRALRRRLAERLQRRRERLPRRQHALEEVAVAADAVEHGVHRERRRIERLVHLVPAQRRRDRRARPSAAPSRRTAIVFPSPFWFESISTPRRFAFVHSVVTRPGCARASAPATISANSRVVVVACAGARSARARGSRREPLVFGKRLEPEQVEHLLDEQRDLDHLGEADVGRGVEVEEHPVGPVGLSTREYHVFMSMQPMFDHPEERELVVDEREVDQPPLRGRRASRPGTARVGIQSGMCFGASFWKKNLPCQPSG